MTGCFLHPGWHLSYLWSLCFCWPYSVCVWLVWLSQMQYSCLWDFKYQWNNWNWNNYLQICWHQEKIYPSSTSGLYSTIIWNLLFQPSSLPSELGRKEHHLWYKIHLTNWNLIHIPIDTLLSPIFQLFNI